MTPDLQNGSSAVLLLGNYRPTISLVRSLKPLGYHVIVGLGGGEGCAEYSRFTDEVWDHPPLRDERDAFLSALGSFLARRPDVRVVFPVAEEFVRIVSAGRDALPADRTYALPPREVVAAALDKLAVYALARALAVPVAPFAVAKTHAELRERCEEVGYPLVLRPSESTHRLHGKKALIVASSDELASTVPVWPADEQAIVVQRRVGGRRHNVYFAARAGRIVRIVETVIDRTDEPDGTGLAVEGRSVPLSPDLARFTEILTTALAYTGVGCAQFLVDRQGSANLLEINPRIAGNHAIAEAAGLELGYLSVALGYLSVALAETEPPEVPFVSGTPGLLYAWTYGDLRGLGEALKSRRLSLGAAARWAGRIALAMLRAQVHMTWRWDDPAPTVMLYARQLPVLRRLRRRGARRALRLARAGTGARA